MDDFMSACGEGESALHHTDSVYSTCNIINLVYYYSNILHSKYLLSTLYSKNASIFLTTKDWNVSFWTMSTKFSFWKIFEEISTTN